MFWGESSTSSKIPPAGFWVVFFFFKYHLENTPQNNYLYRLTSDWMRKKLKCFSFAISASWYHMSVFYNSCNCMYFNTCPLPMNCGAHTTLVQRLGVENKQKNNFAGNRITAKLQVTSKLKHGRWQIRADPLQRYGFTSSEMHNNEQFKLSPINYGKMNFKYLIFKQKKLHVCTCGNIGSFLQWVFQKHQIS